MKSETPVKRNPVLTPAWATTAAVVALTLAILMFAWVATHNRGTAPAVYHGTTSSVPSRVALCPTAPTNGVAWYVDGDTCEGTITMNGVAISFMFGPDNVLATWMWKTTCGSMGYDFSAPATPKYFGETTC